MMGATGEDCEVDTTPLSVLTDVNTIKNSSSDTFDLADINLSSLFSEEHLCLEESSVSLAAPKSADISGRVYVSDGNPLSSPRPLISITAKEPPFMDSLVMAYTVKSSNLSNNYNFKLVAKAHCDDDKVNVFYNRKIFVDLGTEVNSIRTTCGSRIVRESLFPTTFIGDTSCVHFDNFINSISDFEFQIDLAEVSLGVGCEQLRPIALRNGYLQFLNRGFDKLECLCNEGLVNQGKGHRLRPNQEPETVDNIRSNLARINSISQQIVEIENTISTSYETSAKDFGKLMVHNERLRRQIESLRRSIVKIYPNIDFRPTHAGFTNHAKSFNATLINSFVSEIPDHLPALLSIATQAFSLAHYASKCSTVFDWTVFVSSLLARFALSNCCLEDLTTFIIDIISEDGWVEDDEDVPPSSKFNGLKNHAGEAKVEINVFDNMVDMLSNQWSLLRKIMAVGICLSFCSVKDQMDVFPSCAKAAVLWITGFSADVKDLPKLIIQIVEELSKRIYRVFITGDFATLFADDPPPLIKRVLDFQNNARSHMTDTEMMSEVVVPVDFPVLLAQGQELIKELELAIARVSLTPDGMTSRGYFLSALKETLSCYRDLEHYNRKRGYRRMPFGIASIGPPGAGKSHAVPYMFAQIFPSLAGVKYDERLVAPLNPSENFQSAPTAAHLGLVIDDIGQIIDKDGSAQRNIFQIMSCTEYYYDKAEVHEKGRVPCNACAVIVTSNDDNLGAVNKIHSMSALFRRFVIVQFSLRPECIREGEFYKNPDFLNDYWLVDVVRKMPTVTKGEAWDPNAVTETIYTTTDGVKCSQVSLKIALKAISELAVKHRLAQDAAERAYASKDMTSICDDCFCLKAYCECMRNHARGFSVFSSREKNAKIARKHSRQRLTEQALAAKTPELGLLDKLWYHMPGAVRLEDYFRGVLVGNNEAFEAMSKRFRAVGVGAGLLALSTTGGGLVTFLTGLTAATVEAAIRRVDYLKDISKENPKEPERQEKLVRKFCQFFTFGSLLLLGYVSYKSWNLLKRTVGKDDQSDANPTPLKEETGIELPKIPAPIVNHSDEAEMTSSSESDTPRIDFHRNVWRPTFLGDVRAKTGGSLTMHPDHVHARLKDAMCEFTTYQDDKPIKSVNALIVKSNLLLVNWHIVAAGGNNFQLKFAGGNAACSVKRSPLHPSLVYRLRDITGGYKDLCLVNAVNTPALKDNMALLADELPYETPANVIFLEEGEFSKIAVFAKMDRVRQPFLNADGTKEFSDMTVFTHVPPKDRPPKLGDCGSLLITANATPRLIGMHACGRDDLSVSVAFTRMDIQNAIDFLKQKDEMFCHALVIDTDRKLPLGPEEKKSYVHRLKPDTNVTPIAKLDLPTGRAKYSTRKYGLEEYFAKIPHSKEFDQPRKQHMWEKSYEICNVTGDMIKCPKDIDEIRWATNDYIYTVESRLPNDWYTVNNLGILSLHEVLNGVKEEGIPPMDLSKSAGITTAGGLTRKGGPKSQWTEELEDGTIVLTPDFQKEYDEVERRLDDPSSDNLVMFVFDLFAKDEPRALSDEGVQKTFRPIFGGEFISLIFEMRVLRRLFTAIAKQPFYFEMALALYSQRDWDALRKYLGMHLKESEGKLACGDFVHFDQSKDYFEHCSEVFTYMHFLRRSNDLTSRELLFAKKVLYSIAFAGFNMNSELIIAMLGASGKFGTFASNCITCSVRIRRAWKIKYPSVGDYGVFAENVRLVTGGDDHAVVSVGKLDLGMMDMYRAFTPQGIGYTDPEKKVPTVNFTKFEEFEFFKRNMVHVSELGVKADFYTGALDKNSIYKTLTCGQRKIIGEDTSMAQRELFMQSSMTCLAEALLHGKEYYEEVRNSLYSLFCDWGIEDWLRPDEFAPYEARIGVFIHDMQELAKERNLDTVPMVRPPA